MRRQVKALRDLSDRAKPWSFCSVTLIAPIARQFALIRSRRGIFEAFVRAAAGPYGRPLATAARSA